MTKASKGAIGIINIMAAIESLLRIILAQAKITNKYKMMIAILEINHSCPPLIKNIAMENVAK